MNINDLNFDKKLDKLWYWWHSKHCHGDSPPINGKYRRHWTVKVCEFLEKLKYKFDRR